MARFYKYDLGL